MRDIEPRGDPWRPHFPESRPHFPFSSFRVKIAGTLVPLECFGGIKHDLRVRGDCVVKLVTENLEEAAKFDRMAEEASTPALKEALQGQAAAYRKLAARRAADQNSWLVDTPATTAQPQPAAQQQSQNDG